jgi:hypothetical protein
MAHQSSTFITRENMRGAGQLLKQTREILAVRRLAERDDLGARGGIQPVSRDNFNVYRLHHLCISNTRDFNR